MAKKKKKLNAIMIILLIQNRYSLDINDDLALEVISGDFTGKTRRKNEKFKIYSLGKYKSASV